MSQLQLDNDPRTVLVDDCYYPKLSQWQWHITPSGQIRSRKKASGRQSIHNAVHLLATCRHEPGIFGPANGDWFDARAENTICIKKHNLPESASQGAREVVIKSKFTLEPIGDISTANIVRLQRRIEGEKQ